jgi:hypothetical protein
LLAWADLSLESVHCRGALTCSALSHALQRFRHAVDRFGIKCSAGQERTDRHNTAPHGNLRAQKKRQASRPSISAPRQGVSRHERRGRVVLFGHHRASTDALGARCGLATPPTGVDHAANRENSHAVGMGTVLNGVGVGDRTQVWRHGYTGLLLATYDIDDGTISAVRASRSCAPSGPPANAPGPRYGIANGRNAGTCRGGGTPRRAPVCDDDVPYVQVTCLVCAQAHLMNPKTR